MTSQHEPAARGMRPSPLLVYLLLLIPFQGLSLGAKNEALNKKLEVLNNQHSSKLKLQRSLASFQNNSWTDGQNQTDKSVPPPRTLLKPAKLAIAKLGSQFKHKFAYDSMGHSGRNQEEPRAESKGALGSQAKLAPNKLARATTFSPLRFDDHEDNQAGARPPVSMGALSSSKEHNLTRLQSEWQVERAEQPDSGGLSAKYHAQAQTTLSSQPAPLGGGGSSLAPPAGLPMGQPTRLNGTLESLASFGGGLWAAGGRQVSGLQVEEVRWANNRGHRPVRHFNKLKEIDGEDDDARFGGELAQYLDQQSEQKLNSDDARQSDWRLEWPAQVSSKRPILEVEDVRVSSDLVFVRDNSSIAGLPSAFLSAKIEPTSKRRHSDGPSGSQQAQPGWAPDSLERRHSVGDKTQRDDMQSLQASEVGDEDHSFWRTSLANRPPVGGAKLQSSLAAAVEGRDGAGGQQRFGYLKGTSASSGIRVTAGESPYPLVISSSGLIMAAKRNTTARPTAYNHSLLASQMDHSLNPIHAGLNGSHLSLDSNSRPTTSGQDRPSFLREPPKLSNTIYRNNSHQADQSATNNSFAAIEEEILNSIPATYEEPANNEPSLDKRQSVNRTQQSPLQILSFSHNPPYKQQHLQAQLADLAPIQATSGQNGSANNNSYSDDIRTSSGSNRHKQPANNKSRPAPSANGRRKPQGQAQTLKPPSGSQNQMGASSGFSLPTTTHFYEPVTTLTPLEINSSATISPQLNLLAHSTASSLPAKPFKIRDKLQYIIGKRLLKNPAALSPKPTHGPAQQAQASSVATQAPSLLSSTVANNVASLLAQKLNIFARPNVQGSGQHPSFGLNSLFGIRVANLGGHQAANSGGTNKFKQKMNPFASSAHQNINRRTTGMGSLLFSGFIYGLSMLPALMALTGTNPLASSLEESSTSDGPFGALQSSLVANRHSSAEQRRVRKSNLQKLLNNPAGQGSTFAYLVPLLPPAMSSLNADEHELPTGPIQQPGSEAQQSALKALYAPPPTVLDQSSLTDNELLQSGQMGQQADSIEMHTNPDVQAKGQPLPAPIQSGHNPSDDLQSYKTHLLYSQPLSGSTNAPWPESSPSRHHRDLGAWQMGEQGGNVSNVRKWPFDDYFGLSEEPSGGFGALFRGQSSNQNHDSNAQQPAASSPFIPWLVLPPPDRRQTRRQTVRLHRRTTPVPAMTFDNQLLSSPNWIENQDSRASLFLLGNRPTLLAAATDQRQQAAAKAFNGQQLLKPLEQHHHYNSHQLDQNFPTSSHPIGAAPELVANAVHSSHTKPGAFDSGKLEQQVDGETMSLNSLDDYVNRRRRRTIGAHQHHLSGTNGRFEPVILANFAPAFVQHGAISIGDSRLHPIYSKENQPALTTTTTTQNPLSIQFKVGSTLNYIPMPNEDTKQSSLQGSSRFNASSNGRQWRAIPSPLKIKSETNLITHQPLETTTTESPTIMNDKSVTHDDFRHGSAFAMRNSDSKAGTKQLLARPHRRKQTKSGARKPRKPKRRLTTSTTAVPVFNNSASELLLAHTMAMGSKVANEPL